MKENCKQLSITIPFFVYASWLAFN